MQELQQYFTEMLEGRNLKETKEVGLEAFLDYVVEQDVQCQVERKNCGEKIWEYIKRTCD